MTPEEALDWQLGFIDGLWNEYGTLDEEPTRDEAEAVLRRMVAQE